MTRSSVQLAMNGLATITNSGFMVGANARVYMDATFLAVLKLLLTKMSVALIIRRHISLGMGVSRVSLPSPAQNVRSRYHPKPIFFDTAKSSSIDLTRVNVVPCFQD